MASLTASLMAVQPLTEDIDDDADGILDDYDAFPLDASETTDTDSDGSVTTLIPTMTAMDGLTPMTGQTSIRVNGWILTETASVTMQMLMTMVMVFQTAMTPTP